MREDQLENRQDQKTKIPAFEDPGFFSRNTARTKILLWLMLRSIPGLKTGAFPQLYS
jgi:hypothetical protein